MAKGIEHSLNWCRLCRTCLTCKRFPRNLFRAGSCKCVERHITHRAKDVKKHWTTDFRFRHLKRGEVLGLIYLSQQIEGFSHPIEPELTRANLCGTCQQRLRRAVDATKEPIRQVGSSMAVSADFRKHRSIRETIRKHNMANSALSPAASEDRAGSYSPGNVWPPTSQGYADLQTSKRCASHNDLSAIAEASSAPPVVGPQLRLSSSPVLQQSYIQEQIYADDNIGQVGNNRHNSSETSTIALSLPVSSKYRVIKITLYDAEKNPLFTERASGNMTIQELMYSYYPHAPKTLLFRESRTHMLVSTSLPLANLASDSDDISIVAHQPPLVKNAFWETGPILNPYPQPRDGAYNSILRADPIQLAALQPKRADGHHIVYSSTETSDNARFGRRLSFRSSAALTPLAVLDNSYDPGCKRSESIDVESNSSQNLPQLNFDKALSFLEVNQSKEAPLDRRHDISVQSLSGICSSSSLANNRNNPHSMASWSNGAIVRTSFRNSGSNLNIDMSSQRTDGL